MKTYTPITETLRVNYNSNIQLYFLICIFSLARIIHILYSTTIKRFIYFSCITHLSLSLTHTYDQSKSTQHSQLEFPSWKLLQKASDAAIELFYVSVQILEILNMKTWRNHKWSTTALHFLDEGTVFRVVKDPWHIESCLQTSRAHLCPLYHTTC